MTKEKLFLLLMLKSFICEEKLNFDTELDWPKLMRLCAIHSVRGILGYMAMQNPSEKTEQLAPVLKKQCLANIAAFTQRGERARSLLSELSEAGIDHVVFKGYVVRDYYPVPELRSFGDIDLLIKPADRKKCHELMLKRELAVKTDWEPVYCYYSPDEIYEIHTELMEIDVSDKADYKGYFAKAWDNAVKVSEHCYELTPEFHFVYLLTHIAKHICGAGAGIRMYMDLAVFIKHFGDSVDWECVKAALCELKLSKLANMALTISEKCLGVKSPIELEKIEDESFESFLNFTLDGGLFGFVGRDSALVTLKNSEKKTRTATVASRLFPKAETIERRYTYLQGRHWLLPVAWVHRFIKTSDKLTEHKNEARRIYKADEAEVEKLKRIYTELGL